MIIVVLLVVSACADGISHPLDDSETKPATLAEAHAEATLRIDDVAAAVIGDGSFETDEWHAAGGCATNQNSPEQGEVSRILYRSYASLPDGVSASSVIADAFDRWEAEGFSVGPGAPNMPEQTIGRINGISYAVVDTDPGVELRAFLPCY